MAYGEMWEIEVRHEGLNKYRYIKGSDKDAVEKKALMQRLVWDEMWDKKQTIEQRKYEKENSIRSKEEKKELADTKTLEAEKAIKQLEQILQHTLGINDVIDWGKLLNHQKYTTKEPKSTTYSVEKPTKPISIEAIPEPCITDIKYLPSFGLIDKFSSKSKQKKLEAAEKLFNADHDIWAKTLLLNNQNNIDWDNGYQENLKKWEYDKTKHEQNEIRNLEKWKVEKSQYEEGRTKENLAILEKKNQYLAGNADAITDYCDLVLANSEYPDCFSQDWNLNYQADAGIMVVDYSLPSVDDLPTTKAIKYIATRDEFVESTISASELNKLYDSVIYQVALRTIHELFEADVVNALSSIVFNGWVRFIEKSTGRDSNACIISVQAEQDEFMAINLERVEPRACFTLLKGVGSSKLHGLTPVAPIIKINTQDKRFVSSYEVASSLDESVNLAAIDWQDFENLIREVFEKEFSSNGGEVKITQASRDGGVDAVAFDPDPIRGGKIVIQAKRYTNVVGVSAVRDLYGTTMNEGATKGILVTTANYGPDAYEFAKGKPLTLLNGSNLLHLLEKHGHKAKIDLKEAKAILNAEKLQER